MLYLLGIVIILLAPAVIGLFWGAPLIARELETGTSALAWNQSVTRTRWLAVKLAVGGLAAMAVTEALSLMQAWWAAPIGRAVGRRRRRPASPRAGSARWTSPPTASPRSATPRSPSPSASPPGR